MIDANPFVHDIPLPKKGIGTLLVDILQAVVVGFALLVVGYLFIFIPNQVDGDSMLPNFVNKQQLLTNKIIQLVGTTDIAKNYDYKRGDVVIFQKPNHDDFIKRIIALPGDRIMIEDSFVYINGSRIYETYIPREFQTKTYTFLSEGEEKTVPQGHYFLMGDNRSNSKDSRFDDIGFVERRHIKGRVFLRWWPFEEFGLIKQGVIEYNVN
jgi:signal peptidase I